MIKVENVNKYYNRFKNNEIHVINNTSLELGDTGLVAFLGESGCGKTTLLNAIGGLNRVNSGKIYINGKKLPKKCGYRKDKIRTLNIGYIFQDYNLIDDMNVFDNIALTLKMIGFKNKEEIKERVNYVLEKVDMYRFRNKMAGSLSGGQRQRVGIARAIVKNPAVIIADEPTGNLDSKNTIEIMNIIKAISKEKLVILVTHEKNIAKFYASKIVNLEDGKIINIIDENTEAELDYKMDNKVYLKDFDNNEKLTNKNYDINIYNNNEDKIKLDIVVKNGNVYIRSNNSNKIEIIDDYSSVELVNDTYKKISKDDYLKSNFDLNKLSNNKKLKYCSIYNVFTMIKDGVNRVTNYKFLKKMLLLGFLVSSMFILYSVSNITAITTIKDEDFVEKNKEYIYVHNLGIDKYNELKNTEGIKYVLPGDSKIDFNVYNDDLYQFRNLTGSITTSVSGISMIKEEDILYGKLPSNSQEIVLDKLIYEKNKGISSSFPLKYIGINSEEELLNLKLSLNGRIYTVVGVVDKSSPSLYVNENEFQIILLNKLEVTSINEGTANYKLYEGADINLKKGRLPENDYETIVNISNEENYPLGKEISEKINDTKLKVVGYYTSNYENNSFYVNNNMITRIILEDNKGFSIYSNDKIKTISLLKQKGYNAEDVYNTSKNNYKKQNEQSIKNSLIISVILLLISFIEIFFIIRASFLSKVKEIGIKRAIGIKKMDIYKMFLGEILVITTLTGIPGVLCMSAILKEVSKISLISSQYVINLWVVIISLIIVYILNIIIGLLPVTNLIKKEPADILSRTDI